MGIPIILLLLIYTDLLMWTWLTDSYDRLKIGHVAYFWLLPIQILEKKVHCR